MNDREKIKIFFAIPCGEFFSIQNGIIKAVCKAFNVRPVIIEDHSRTENLWHKIKIGVEEADYFIADISSLSPNIILELGYVIRAKKSKYYGIFIASTIEVPIDLQGFTLQKYSSFNQFKEKLGKWIKDNIPTVPNINTNTIKLIHSLPDEDFSDRDRFLRLWTNPPYASFYFTAEGMHLTNSHLPIMTNYLGLLHNYEFTFKAKLLRGAIGWIVKGTKSYTNILPDFCIMFNIGTDNKLTPHILNIQNLVQNTDYHVFERLEITKMTKDWLKNWFTITTRVEDDVITILNEDKILFKADFNKNPYKQIYSYPNKQGEVGFRCHPSEECIIRYMKIKEI